MIVIFLSLALSSLQQSWFLVSVTYRVHGSRFMFSAQVSWSGWASHLNVFCDTGTQILLLRLSPLVYHFRPSAPEQILYAIATLLSWIKGLCGTKCWIGVTCGNESSTNIKVFSCEVNHLKIIEQEHGVKIGRHLRIKMATLGGST